MTVAGAGERGQHCARPVVVQFTSLRPGDTARALRLRVLKLLTAKAAKKFREVRKEQRALRNCTTIARHRAQLYGKIECGGRVEAQQRRESSTVESRFPG
jgi:hypothetical protein